MTNDRLVNEAVHFFKTSKGFDRLLNKMAERYVSLGRIGGTVTLTQLSPTEQEALTTFFQKDYSRKQSATIKLQAFEEQLQTTRFKEVALLALLEAYLGYSLRTKAEQLQEQEEAEEKFFAAFTSTDPLVEEWLAYVKAKGRGTKSIHTQLSADPEAAKQMIDILIALHREVRVKKREERYERLPIFAQRMTGNPHALDSNNELGVAFLSLLQWLYTKEVPDATFQTSLNTEQTNELLQHFCIFRDDIANFVTCFRLLAKKEGTDSTVFQSALEEKTVLNLPLREVLRLNLASSAYGGPIIIVENSGVFSELVHVSSQQERSSAIICLHGQPKLAGILLLRLLDKQNEPLFYAGDWDPEGLLIAARLQERFPRLQTIWQTHSDIYERSSGVEIPRHRLKKLDHVTNQQLQRAKQQLLEHKVAFYQEQYIDLLADMVKRCNF